MSGLRVALMAGTLGRGGAEQQLVYTAAALTSLGADVHVYSLTRGEQHEEALRAAGLPITWIGRFGHPAIRLSRLVAGLLTFRPHLIQAGHFFTNLYVTHAARVVGAAAVGTIRSDAVHELATHGRWGESLLLGPPDIIANSWGAKAAAELHGRAAATTHVVSNVVDVARFTGARTADPTLVTAIAVGSLIHVKRFDRLVEALAAARERSIALVGVLVGGGPERESLADLAAALSLGPSEFCLLGDRDDVPQRLATADFLVLTSSHEGCPNVILEAMAAALPVVAMDCGDVRRLVVHGSTGFVVPQDDMVALVDCMVALARSPELRRRLGDAGRRRVEAKFGRASLPETLLGVYRAIAERRQLPTLLAATG